MQSWALRPPDTGHLERNFRITRWLLSGQFSDSTAPLVTVARTECSDALPKNLDIFPAKGLFCERPCNHKSADRDTLQFWRHFSR